MPTLNEIARADYPGKIDLPGDSLLPILEDSPTKPRTLYFEHESNRAILDGKWKLVALKQLEEAEQLRDPLMLPQTQINSTSSRTSSKSRRTLLSYRRAPRRSI